MNKHFMGADPLGASNNLLNDKTDNSISIEIEYGQMNMKAGET